MKKIILYLLLCSTLVADNFTYSKELVAKEFVRELKEDLKDKNSEIYQILPPATYIGHISVINHLVKIEFIYNKKELINEVYKQSNLNILEASKAVNSEDFLYNVRAQQPSSWMRSFCKGRILNYLNRDILISLSLNWDDKTPIIESVAIDKYVCSTI